MNAEDVKKLRATLGITQRELAQKLGVSLKTITNYENGGVIPDSKRQLLISLEELAACNINVKKIGINKNGKIEASEYNSRNKYVSDSAPRNSIYSSLEYKIVPLLPIAARGGTLNDFVVSVKPDDCEKVISPVRDADFAMTVTGDSMAPEYPSGSRILIKKIDERAFIEWGRVYVLDTCNGSVIKKIMPGPTKEQVRCESLNPEFPGFNVSFKDMYGMYRVLMLLTEK